MTETATGPGIGQARPSDTRTLTMAQALVLFLQAQFSERDGQRRRLIPAIFGIFGHGNVMGLGQALDEYGTELPYHQARNEQSMVHAAIGHAKATQRLATLACTSSIGPGATNMVTGAASATVNRLPVLLLPGDIYATRLQGPVLQQLEHASSGDTSVNDCFRPVSRYFDRISRPEQLIEAMPEAMRVLTDPVETGAVTIALPQDVQTEAYRYPSRFFEERTWAIERTSPPQAAVDEAVRLLARAQRPVIIAGGGVQYSDASAELESFMGEFGIPVAETYAGKGAVRNPSPLLLGGAGLVGTQPAHAVMSQADLVISVGTRLADFTTGSNTTFMDPEVRFVNLNVAGHDARKLGALELVADAREGLRALSDAARGLGIAPNAEYVREVAGATRAWSELVDGLYERTDDEAPLTQAQMVGVINRSAQDGDVVVTAAGTLPGDIHMLWDASRGRRCHLEFGYSCMGYEIPGSLGVRMAQPTGEVVVCVGDGTYLMNPSEILTAVQDGLKITVVISENHGFQSIHGLQRSLVVHSFGNEFRSRDSSTGRLDGPYLTIGLAANAASLGARTWQVANESGLAEALDAARSEQGPCVIVVETDPHERTPASGVWWDASPPEVSGDEGVARSRSEYEAKRRAQTFYG